MAYTKHRVEMELAGRTLSIETGHWAKQADGAAVVQYGETVVLGTVVRATPRTSTDFLPLTVEYREKMSACGKFPGGFRKREDGASAKETLTMRNIDRPLRPMFPKNFMDEVQVNCQVLSYDGENEPDVIAGIAASAALALSSIPFDGPVASVRVARVDGELTAMPTLEQDAYSDIDLLLCGHEGGVNMIEVGAYEVPEADLLEAVEFGHEHILRITAMIQKLVKKAGKTKAASTYAPNGDAQAELAAQEAKKAAARDLIRSGKRSDGRKADELREIECLVGVLPRVHGSSLFTRGGTQALVTATLGTGKDEQVIDGLNEEYAEKFYLHYNFPAFAVGQTKRAGSPGRREIGHGKLAERALLPILPDIESFPYTVRLVSDILESNGSSSMASACGGSLALMDAGVPITAPVAGISIGLIAAEKKGQKDVYLTDIQGEEDNFGDMDFKVCGTRQGVTAVQIDLKIKGLSLAQVKKSFELARKHRLEIIDLMEAALPAPRADISPYAPRMLSTQVSLEKLGKIIGPAGKMLRELEEMTGAKIEIEEDGTIHVSAIGAGKAEAAIREIEKLGAECRLGAIYTGRVTGLKDFGAFVEVIPGQDGLCHVSEITDSYVEKVSDILAVGQEVRVKVMAIDEQGRVKVSRKAAMKDEGTAEDPAILAKLEAKKTARTAREAERAQAPRREASYQSRRENAPKGESVAAVEDIGNQA